METTMFKNIFSPALLTLALLSSAPAIANTDAKAKIEALQSRITTHQVFQKEIVRCLKSVSINRAATEALGNLGWIAKYGSAIAAANVLNGIFQQTRVDAFKKNLVITIAAGTTSYILSLPKTWRLRAIKANLKKIAPEEYRALFDADAKTNSYLFLSGDKAKNFIKTLYIGSVKVTAQLKAELATLAKNSATAPQALDEAAITQSVLAEELADAQVE